MGVGAILLFLGSLLLPPSLSLSLMSRFTPLLPEAVLLPTTELAGVSGGVVIGTPVTLAELVAAMLGTLPPIRVGLFITLVEACVTTDDVELDLAGEDGRTTMGMPDVAETNDAVATAGGDGAANELDEFL